MKTLTLLPSQNFSAACCTGVPSLLCPSRREISAVRTEEEKEGRETTFFAFVRLDAAFGRLLLHFPDQSEFSASFRAAFADGYFSLHDTWQCCAEVTGDLLGLPGKEITLVAGTFPVLEFAHFLTISVPVRTGNDRNSWQAST